MATEREIRERIVATTKQVADHLYTFITPDSPVEYKTADLAEALGFTQPMSDDRCIELQSLGILTRTINFGHRDPDGTWRIGRFAMWGLHKTKAEADAILAAWGKQLVDGETASMASKRDTASKNKAKLATAAADTTVETNKTGSQHGGYKGTTVATNEAEEVKAIAGPDAPSPMEALRPLRKSGDADALIAAARQYAVRGDKMDEHIEALLAAAKTLGIEVDSAAITGGIHLSRDERLESIALVLPVIDGMQATIDRLTTQVGELRQKAKVYDQMVIDNRRLRTRLEALVSERVTAAQHVQ